MWLTNVIIAKTLKTSLRIRAIRDDDSYGDGSQEPWASP
jgi:hypothetical protein